MTTKYGVFREMPGIGQGDPFVDTVKSPEKDHGLNFKVATCKQGKTNDATFDKFKPLYQGEPYVDPLKARLQAAKAAKKSQVTEAAWKSASLMKASVMPGDFYGTFQGKVPYMPPGTQEVHKKKGEVKGEPRNITTGPSKKGGFGFNKTTLSERKGATGVAGEYAYVADPIHQASRKRETAPPVAPFRPVNKVSYGGPGTVTRNFGGRAKGAMGEFEWVPRPEPPVKSRAAGAAAEGGDTEAAADSRTAFRPAGQPKRDITGTTGRYPEYLHDPETWKAEARATQRARERELLAAHSGGAWRPGGGTKSDAMRSIVQMNIGRNW